MKITIIGTGYVGLVTGVCLADIGHSVTCLDIDNKKIEKLASGISPIYEPGLEELMKKNSKNGRLSFSTNYDEGCKSAEVIYIAVGTPQKRDGTADLQYIESAAKSIAKHITNDIVIVTKSTVPVGTNEYIKRVIEAELTTTVSVEIVSNPEFLREGSAIHDAFHGDRIVIGAENKEALAKIVEINQPFGIPIYQTDLRSAEMIKYAANAFLATKISFINEISNICEKLGANVEDVATGIGMDHRIGDKFLQAGIGYGGSCFPKDTNALVQIAGNVDYDFSLLKAVIEVNNRQPTLLVQKAKERFGSLQGKRVALLGLAFKPNTDDMREAASITIANMLREEGAQICAYDPIAIENAKRVLPPEVCFVKSLEAAFNQADVAMIATEWKEIKELDLSNVRKWMKTPIIFDGRNCFSLDDIRRSEIEYHSVGRPPINL